MWFCMCNFCHIREGEKPKGGPGGQCDFGELIWN